MRDKTVAVSYEWGQGIPHISWCLYTRRRGLQSFKKFGQP